MGEIRYIIIAKQCEVVRKSSILDGCLKKSFSLVYDLGKRFIGHPSRIDDFPCNLPQFCYTHLSVLISCSEAWVGVGVALDSPGIYYTKVIINPRSSCYH